jgi:lysophospholipase L1-like esterase
VIGRIASRLVGLCRLLVVAALLAAAPATAARERYVALGDSYSSGTGTGRYDLARGCQRSRDAYPALVAARRPKLELVFAACSGATTSDVLATQVQRVTPATRWVTITIGGNDAGFIGVITACAGSDAGGACGRAIGRARERIRHDLPGRIDRVLREIRRRAPDARVIVLGYPRLFAGAGCDARTSFTRAETAALNRGADLLRDTLRARVRAAGGRVRFADAIPAFAGHGICSGADWIHGLADRLGDSFHPNRAGYRSGYTPLVLRAMR